MQFFSFRLVCIVLCNHLNTGLNSPVFERLGCVITILKLQFHHFYILPFEILPGFQISFEYRTLKSPIFRCWIFRWLQYSCFAGLYPRNQTLSQTSVNRMWNIFLFGHRNSTNSWRVNRATGNLSPTFVVNFQYCQQVGP